MKTGIRLRLRALAAAFAGIAMLSDTYAATTDTMPPVGSVALPALANSDTLISLPLSRAAAYSGLVSAVAGDVLTVLDSPSWTTNQFVKNLPDQTDTYYVQFRTGSAAGHFYTITANSAASLTVDWNGETPSITPGDAFDLIPYWTLGTVYPATDAGKSFIVSTSALLRKTELLFPDPAYVGINPPPAATFYFLNGAWRKIGAPATTSFSDTVIPPDTYFIQRNKAESTRIANVGEVVTGPLATLVIAQSGIAKQDNPISLRFAGTVTLAASNLVGSGAFQPSTSALIRKDELLVFDNTATGINKPPVATYYYLNGGWRKVGSPATVDFGADAVFTAGRGIVIRKAGVGSNATESFWVYNVDGL